MVKVFKEGGERREKNVRPYTPPPSRFSIFIPEYWEMIALLQKDLPWRGRRSPACHGGYRYLEPRIKT